MSLRTPILAADVGFCGAIVVTFGLDCSNLGESQVEASTTAANEPCRSDGPPAGSESLLGAS